MKGLANLKSAAVALALLAFLPYVGAADDAAKHHAGGFNVAHEPSVEMRNEGGVKVVFIGNSITLHAPLPAIGWTNCWGMAASGAERDYAHLVVRGIERREKRTADVRIRNLADFERNFETYDLSRLDDLVAFGPDYLVVALGENVPDLAGDGKVRYGDAFTRLLARFTAGGRKPKIVVRGVFWANGEKDSAMSGAAKRVGASFVKADIGNDPSMQAAGRFSHAGVAAHPGDAGMAEIARRILKAFFVDQKKSQESQQ